MCSFLRLPQLEDPKCSKAVIVSTGLTICARFHAPLHYTPYGKAAVSEPGFDTECKYIHVCTAIMIFNIKVSRAAYRKCGLLWHASSRYGINDSIVSHAKSFLLQSCGIISHKIRGARPGYIHPPHSRLPPSTAGQYWDYCLKFVYPCYVSLYSRSIGNMRPIHLITI